jgi:hypothetical protein
MFATIFFAIEWWLRWWWRGGGGGAAGGCVGVPVRPKNGPYDLRWTATLRQCGKNGGVPC